MDGEGGLLELSAEATAHLPEASPAHFLSSICTQVTERTASRSHD